MNKKFLFILATLILLLFSLHFVFLRIDYLRVKNEQKPFFSIQEYLLTDGGSIGYIGLGYRIESICSLGSEEKGGKTVDGNYIGVKVTGLPGLSILDNMITKNEVKFITNSW